MSARKLGRLVGLVLVLAAFFGATGGTGVEGAAGDGAPAVMESSDSIDWL
jgi:hypothetical protein